MGGLRLLAAATEFLVAFGLALTGCASGEPHSDPSAVTPAASAEPVSTAVPTAQPDWSLEERLRWAVDVAAAVTAVKEAYPHDFAYARIDDFRVAASIAFTGAVPVGAADLVGGLPGVELVADSGSSEQQLSDYSGALRDVLGVEFETAVFSVVSHVDAHDRTIELVITGPVPGDPADPVGPAAVDPAELERIAQRARELAKATPPPPGVTVVVTVDPVHVYRPD